MDLEQRIEIYIDAYLATHPICTLSDMEDSIVTKERVSNPHIQNYDDLRLGPLLRHPKVCFLAINCQVH
jgi:hypothetical protein